MAMGTLMPLIATSPIFSRFACFKSSAVDCETNNEVPYTLFKASSRAAKFTVSPWTV